MTPKQIGLGEAFTAEVRDAWSSAYLFLSYTMQNAAAEGTVDLLAVPEHA